MIMYQVDAFAAQVFGGNPAAVLLCGDWLPEARMQAIAQENNLAETAFARPRGDGDWDLRWFTPVCEVAFCGHATLATAHVLIAHEGAAAPLVFHTRVGALRVTGAASGGASGGAGHYQLDLPRLDPQPLETQPLETRLPGAVADLWSGRPVHLFRSFENLFVDLGSARAVRDFVPDMAAIATLGPIGLAVTGRGAPDEEADFVSRYFAPGAGIPEDPVTGSIHATLVPYWAGVLGRTRLRAFQASARGGWLDCTLGETRVLVGGQARTFMRAELFLPGAAEA